MNREFRKAVAVVGLFKALKAGIPANDEPWSKYGPWNKYRLRNEDEYHEIERLLLDDPDDSLAGFVDDKVRYDYDAARHYLIVRMPSSLHGRLASMVNMEIDAQLEALVKTAEDESVQAFASYIEFYGSTDIYFDGDGDSDGDNNDGVRRGAKSHSSPDGSFYHENSKYPGVILELSYSPKRKDFGRLADHYILDSDANIRAVVDINVEYLGDPDQQEIRREAFFSVWRPALTELDDGVMELSSNQEIKDQPFRDTNGNPSPGDGIVLNLSDFVHPGLTPETKKDPIITISPTTLCEYLRVLEERLEKEKNNSLSSVTLPPGVRRVRRQSTPPDEITKSEREVMRKELDHDD